MPQITVPDKQLVALVREQGGPVEFVDDYPVQHPGQDEVLAKVLYTGVCQSGTAPQIKMPRCMLLILYIKISIHELARHQVPMGSPSQPSNSLTLEAMKV